jgi:hypothetical protein
MALMPSPAAWLHAAEFAGMCALFGVWWTVK